MNLISPIIRLLFLLVIFLAALSIGRTQEIISTEFQTNLSLPVVNLLLASAGVDLEPKYGVDAYKIRYVTTGSDMQPDTASGLMMFPEQIEGPLSIVSFEHITTSGRSDVPSNLEGLYQLGAVFASFGMAVSAPDFVGLGDSRGFHPFIHADTEASASVDMILAVRDYMSSQEIETGEQLFTVGYSQGGHAALATHRLIQEEFAGQLNVTASLPMSGPYDVSGQMRDLFFSDQEYFYPAYLIYATLGVLEIYPETLPKDLTQVFKEKYVDLIVGFRMSGENLFNGLNLPLIDLLETEFGEVVPKRIFKDSILNVLTENLSHPFNIALQSNDVYKWVPEAPIRFLYCPEDDQIPAANTFVADSVFRELGAQSIEVFDVSGGQPLSHMDCVIPAFASGLPWILSFVDDITPTDEVRLNEISLSVFPNPVSDQLNIEVVDGDIVGVKLFEISGGIIRQIHRLSKSEQIDVSSLRTGMYILEVRTTHGVAASRVAIQH